MDPKTQKLADFVTWAAAHITGDEKGQAQIFLFPGQPRPRFENDCVAVTRVAEYFAVDAFTTTASRLS